MPTWRINGFSASILVDGLPLNTSGVVIDRKERTMESYIQARGSKPFTVTWGCRKTDLSSRGDVFVDGVWVGYAYIDHSERPGINTTQKAGELTKFDLQGACIYGTQLASEGWVRQGETAPRQFVFDAGALRIVEEVEMTASAGPSEVTVEGSDVTGRDKIYLPRTFVDEGRTNGGAGEVRLVISRLGRPPVPGTSLDKDFAMGTSCTLRGDNVVLEKLATFTFKYRSKEFLSRMNLFRRPCMNMDRIYEKNALCEMLSQTLQNSQIQYDADVSMNCDDNTSKRKAGKVQGQAGLHRSQNVKAKLKHYREAEQQALAAQKRERRERGVAARAAKREAYIISRAQAQEHVTRKRRNKELRAVSMIVDEDYDIPSDEAEHQERSPIEIPELCKKRKVGYGPRLRLRIRRQDKMEHAQRVREDMAML